MENSESTGGSRILQRSFGVKGRIFIFDLVLVAFTFVVAVIIGEGTAFRGSTLISRWPQFCLVMLAAFVVLYWRRLYRMNSRYLGIYDAVNIALTAAVLGVVELIAQATLVSEISFRWSVPMLFMFLLGTSMMALRLFRRAVWQKSHYPNNVGTDAARTLVVGAGDAGEMVWRELSRADVAAWYVAGFIDDSPVKRGMTIHGVEVLGSVEEIPEIVQSNKIDEIIIAIPSASPEQMRRIFKFCSQTKARIRTIPSYTGVTTGQTKVLPLMREIQVEDLLRRECVESDQTSMRQYYGGERILVTGAGGSIGSELARQTALFHPSTLVLLGRGENSIFEIDQELRQSQIFQGSPIVCDVKDRDGLARVFQAHTPSVVIHAAAHKHVPLMEAVPIEAIRNNVFGTLNVVEESMRNGVKRFLLVSTDKAVKPSNVMGATKRVGEMILAAASKRSDCSFTTVRFGNVLGSRGSLVPILTRQIRMGGPVTITHPDMTRYFMTIPEAVELILQAGSMEGSGDTYILDMGQPVRIMDLAHDMIRMHGLVPGQDIEIKFIGARPGEKLHEELAGDEELLVPSDHDKIQKIGDGARIEWDWLKGELAQLRKLCDDGDVEGARTFLMELSWGKTAPPMGELSEPAPDMSPSDPTE